MPRQRLNVMTYISFTSLGSALGGAKNQETVNFSLLNHTEMKWLTHNDFGWFFDVSQIFRYVDGFVGPKKARCRDDFQC